MTKRLEQGQSLLETMVALAVSTLALTALVSAVVVSVRNAQFAKNQSLATKYAQEGIEKVRIYRDQNDWSDFVATGATGPNCGDEGLVGLSVPSPFTTVVDCVEDPPGSTDRRRVTVTVSWTEAGRTHQSQLTTYLTRWE